MEKIGKKITVLEKVKTTNFGSRHFDRKFGGTKILDMTQESFDERLNSELEIFYKIKNGANIFPELESNVVRIIDGYADFCKLIAVKNFTDARTGTLPITIENYHYLRTGYSSRAKGELPVLSRWFEIPSMFISKAEYLLVVVYDREQLKKEHDARRKKEFDSYEKRKGRKLEEADRESISSLDGMKFDFENDDTQWGIVAILGQMHPGEEPINPTTMTRNHLGESFGGSGVEIDAEKYLESIEFWEKNAVVK